MKSLTEHSARTLALMVFTLLVGLLPAGCGDDEPEVDEQQEAVRKEQARRRALNAANKGKAKNTKNAMLTIQVPITKWRFMEQYFNKHLQGSSLASKNIIAPNADTFIKRPEVKEDIEDPEVASVAAPPVEPKVIHGLEAYDLKRYKLIMIVSGTSVNQAMVLDEKGKQYLVERGTRIGNKGARVQAITQYTVFIQEPDADKPFKLDIEPPFIGLESSPEKSEGDSTVVPKTDLESLLKGVPPTGRPATP